MCWDPPEDLSVSIIWMKRWETGISSSKRYCEIGEPYLVAEFTFKYTVFAGKMEKKGNLFQT